MIRTRWVYAYRSAYPMSHLGWVRKLIRNARWLCNLAGEWSDCVPGRGETNLFLAFKWENHIQNHMRTAGDHMRIIGEPKEKRKRAIKEPRESPTYDLNRSRHQGLSISLVLSLWYIVNKLETPNGLKLKNNFNHPGNPGKRPGSTVDGAVCAFWMSLKKVTKTLPYWKH